MELLNTLVSAVLIIAATTASADSLQIKSELETPPEPLAILKTHLAFNAPPPLVRSMETEAPNHWMHGLSHRVMLEPGSNGIVTAKYSAISRTDQLKKPEHEIANYRQEYQALGGMFNVYLQRRETASLSGELVFHWYRGEMVEISDINGALFPLAVGNSLRLIRVWKNLRNDTTTEVIEYIVRSIEPAKRRYPQLSGKLFVVGSKLNGGASCEILWSEQLQYIVSQKCGSASHSGLISFEMIPEGVAHAARLKQQDDAQDAAAAQKYKKDLAAKSDASHNLTAPMRERAQQMFKQAFDLFQSGEFDAATRQFQNGLEIDPANPVANFYLAETYARQNNAGLAREFYRYTVEFGTNLKESTIADARLARLNLEGTAMVDANRSTNTTNETQEEGAAAQFKGRWKGQGNNTFGARQDWLLDIRPFSRDRAKINGAFTVKSFGKVVKVSHEGSANNDVLSWGDPHCVATLQNQSAMALECHGFGSVRVQMYRE